MSLQDGSYKGDNRPRPAVSSQKQSIYHIHYRVWLWDAHWPQSPDSAYVVAGSPLEAFKLLRLTVLGVSSNDAAMDVHCQSVGFVGDVMAI